VDCVTCRDRQAHSVEGCPAATPGPGGPAFSGAPWSRLYGVGGLSASEDVAGEQAVVGGEAAGVGEAPAGPRSGSRRRGCGRRRAAARSYRSWPWHWSVPLRRSPGCWTCPPLWVADRRIRHRGPPKSDRERTSFDGRTAAGSQSCPSACQILVEHGRGELSAV
jgi:hypothetical protein